MLFGFIWFSVFGGAGINMVRDTAKMNFAAKEQQVVAVLETTILPGSGQVKGNLAQKVDFTAGGKYGCGLVDAVHACAADSNCQYQYLRPPSLNTDLGGRGVNMWYDLMLSYGEPDAFLGWFLYVFS
eukprot:COSAG05_NODE_11587_length_506_cov_0.914005_1_plen_126_part_10